MKTSTILILTGVAAVGVFVWTSQRAAAAAAGSSGGGGLADAAKSAYNAFFASQTDCSKLAPGAKAECEKANLEARGDSTKFGAGLDLGIGVWDKLV